MKNFKFLAIVLFAASLFASCSKENNCVTGRGEYVAKEYNTDIFNAVAVSGSADVHITKDTYRSVRIEAQQSVLNVLDVKVKNGTLTIGEKGCIKNAKRLNIYISTPTLKGLSCSGSVNMFSPDTFSGNTFNANLSGSGKMEFNASVQELNATISGDGKINARGSATQQYFASSGEGSFNCFGLIGEDVDIDVSGKANMEVYSTKTLNIDVSGSSTIYYKGYPTIKQDISGSANLIDAN